MEEVMKEFRMCCDPDVLRGNKFCLGTIYLMAQKLVN